MLQLCQYPEGWSGLPGWGGWVAGECEQKNGGEISSGPVVGIDEGIE